MHHQEYDYTNLILVEKTKLPYVIIKKILRMTGSKNYLTLYKRCINQCVEIVKSSKFIYHKEQIISSNHITYNYHPKIKDFVPKIKDFGTASTCGRRQFGLYKVQRNSEYMKRYIPNDDNKDLEEIEIIFYYHLLDDNFDTVETYDYFEMKFDIPL